MYVPLRLCAFSCLQGLHLPMKVLNQLQRFIQAYVLYDLHIRYIQHTINTHTLSLAEKYTHEILQHQLTPMFLSWSSFFSLRRSSHLSSILSTEQHRETVVCCIQLYVLTINVVDTVHIHIIHIHDCYSGTSLIRTPMGQKKVSY